MRHVTKTVSRPVSELDCLGTPQWGERVEEKLHPPQRWQSDDSSSQVHRVRLFSSSPFSVLSDCDLFFCRVDIQRSVGLGREDKERCHQGTASIHRLVEFMWESLCLVKMFKLSLFFFCLQTVSSNCVSSALLQFCLLCGSSISSSTVSICWVMTLLAVA